MDSETIEQLNLSLLAQNWQLFDVEIRSRPNTKTVSAIPLRAINTYFHFIIIAIINYNVIVTQIDQKT